jgi:hypothetical protein
LKENHGPARQQRGAALALVARAQQALHHELIGPVAGGGEEASAHHSGPKGIGAREKRHGRRKPEIENRELVGRAGHRRHVGPSTGNLAQNNEETGDGAEDVEAHLHHVGPDHGRHPAFKRVKDREQNDEDDGNDFPGAQHNRDDQRDGEDPYPFGQRAGHQEHPGR